MKKFSPRALVVLANLSVLLVSFEALHKSVW